MSSRVLIGGAALAMLVAGAALAQHAPPGVAAPHTQEPYGIETFGVFRDLMLQGDFSPKVALGQVMSRDPSTGVGAVAGARGEITIADGKLIISYGSTDAAPAADAETAALLATGKVDAWQSISDRRRRSAAGRRGFPRTVRAGAWPRPRQVLSVPAARDGCALRDACQCRTDRRPAWHGPADGGRGCAKRRRDRRCRRRPACVDRTGRDRHSRRRTHPCPLGVSGRPIDGAPRSVGDQGRNDIDASQAAVIVSLPLPAEPVRIWTVTD